MRADNVRCQRKWEERNGKCVPTKITEQTNRMYVKKSPGWENFGDAVSSLLPYV
jgi:hypothetical protein